MRDFGELEKAVMEQMWAHADATTVREMVSYLRPERTLAYTTVMTTMDRLVQKGWLSREMIRRAWCYRPTGTRAEWAAGIMSEVLADAQDQGAALIHFVGSMDAVELQTLKAALLQANPERP